MGRLKVPSSRLGFRGSRVSAGKEIDTTSHLVIVSLQRSMFGQWRGVGEYSYDMSDESARVPEESREM